MRVDRGLGLGTRDWMGLHGYVMLIGNWIGLDWIPQGCAPWLIEIHLFVSYLMLLCCIPKYYIMSGRWEFRFLELWLNTYLFDRMTWYQGGKHACMWIWIELDCMDRLLWTWSRNLRGFGKRVWRRESSEWEIWYVRHGVIFKVIVIFKFVRDNWDCLWYLRSFIIFEIIDIQDYLAN